uniref:CCHC-type domain-containing protein n=1 Tax=Cyprinus carpio carpio TaxID=630221 RepID=A0A9J8A398_CYPCA
MAAQPPAPSNPSPSMTSPVSPRLAFPERFDGTPTKCRGFLLQCSLFVNQQPLLYPTESSRIAFVCSLLTGRALEWATAVWRTDGSAFPSFAAFLQQFREVFEHSTERGDAGEQLLTLTQGRSSAAEYALSFRTLAAQTTWVEDTLKLLFRKGLRPELQSELACRDEGRNLNEFIDLTIRIDNLIRSRRPTQAPAQMSHEAVMNQEPMQLGTTHITPEERERRMQNHLCLYCGQPGHMRTSCPVRPSTRSQTWRL